MDGGLARIGAAACRSSPGRRLRRQSWRRRAGRFRLSGLGHAGDGGEFPGRRRGDQPDLQDFRPLAQSLRARAWRSRPETSRRSRRSTKRPAPRQWPSAWRRSPPSPTCSCSARWALATRPQPPRFTTRFTAARRRIGSVGGPASTMRVSGAKRTPSAPQSRAISPILTTRSRSWRASADAKPQRSQARSSPHAYAERRCCSTASSCARRRPCCSPSTTAALDHCLAAHLSAERAHQHALKLIGKAPLLDLGMRLGEGSGGGARGRRREGGGHLPQRHGDLRGSRRRGQGGALSGARAF